MDEWLDSLYQTSAGFGGGSQEMDVERMAQAELLQKVAEANDLDIDEMSDDQVAGLADEVGLDFGEEGGEEAGSEDEIETDTYHDEEGNEFGVAFDDDGTAHIQGQDGNWHPASAFGYDIQQDDGQEKEAMARFDEADFLGRVMAHSYTQEMRKIAGIKEVGQAVVKGGKAVGGFAKKIGKKVGKGGARFGQLMAGGKAMGAKGRVGNVPWKAGKMGSKQKAEMLKSLGTRAGVGGALVAGGLGARAAMKKESSVPDELLERLAMDRAVNFLSQYDLSQYNLDFEPVEEMKVASPVVNEYVDQRAIEMLNAEGFGGLLQ